MVKTGPPNAAKGSSALERCRALYAERAWDDAYRGFAAEDQRAPLGAGDLTRLAMCAGLTGRTRELLGIWERLYDLQLAEQDEQGAAYTAFMLGMRLMSLGELGRASGWFGRARRLVDCQAGDCVASGYLLLVEAERELRSGEAATCLQTAARAASFGERFADRDLLAYARYLQGAANLHLERLDVALPLLDEAMLLVRSEAVSPVFAGMIYCSAIACCQQVYALERAREWTTALACWCDAQPQLVTFTGSCQVHQAEILELGGAWNESLKQAERCVDRFAGVAGSRVGGDALYQKAEIHRLRGELKEAEAGYRAASQNGREPQPGLALLRLAQGQNQAAAAAIRRMLATTAEPLPRTRFLPAAVEILLAVGAFDEAGAATEELERTAARFPSEALSAIAAHARGALLLREGDAARALPLLRSAHATWHRLDAPYIAARVRVHLGQACEALGDADGAMLEFAGAREVLTRLGATPDLAVLGAISGKHPTEPPSHGLTPRELEVLRLIAAGKTNRVIAGELFVSEKTVDRHVSNLFGKLEVGSRAAATAWAYEHGLV